VSRVKGTNRTNIYWDESDRMRVVAASSRMQHYLYDATGERIMKARSLTVGVYINGTLVSSNVVMDNYTTYPSGYFVVDPNGIYSKHYYIGSERIASRIGDGTATQFEGKDAGEVGGLKERQQVDLMRYLSKEGVSEVSFTPYEAPELAVISDESGDQIKPPQISIFYYHPDHLGTNTIVSNIVGNTYQYFVNLPYGETMAEQKSSGYYQSPYKFTGKELDPETGLYYFGARYYDPRVSVWLSVDPMAGERSWVSPYAYCSNNPENKIDPDGMDDYEINKRGRVVNHIETKERDAFFMVDKKGDRIEGKELILKYGAVENFKSQYSDDAKATFDWYNVRGDDNGKQLFDFFANNTKVEWSQLSLGQKGDNGLNIVSTSHETKTERSINFLLDNQYQFGYTIRGHNHNHPNNTPYPSGLDGKPGDVGFAKYLTNISLKNCSGIPSFKIYLPKIGNYIKKLF
jgi:RHS repeat-associated protein